MIKSTWRGHNIYDINGEWFYSDTNEKVYDNPHRMCGHCNKPNNDNDHDQCIKDMPNVLNACCGHGNNLDAYVQFKDYKCIRGEKAINYIERMRNEDTKIH